MTASKRPLIIIGIILALAVAGGWALSNSAHTLPVPALKPAPVKTIAPGPATLDGCIAYVLPGLIVKYPQLAESTLRSEAEIACAKVVNP